jgi:hypothetical protein
VPLPYYARLSPRGQAIYRASAAIVSVPLPRPEEVRPHAEALASGLRGDDRAAVQRAASALAAALTGMLGVPAPDVQVRAVRPTLRASELHGLYTRDDGKPPRIQVWMRTAQRGRVVAFRTFLRTLLHELLHHLDYSYFHLADSLHTEGFFKRESSLVRQVLGEELPPPRA